ncbi:Cytoplasmic glyoxalase II [Elasticomyces elasticus]|nr:Cytoplasmic glyoxalase II [Elasticomyces elasticus]
MTFLAASRFILRHPRNLVIATVGIAAALSWYILADQPEKPVITRKMHIESIPMWEGSGNNYASPRQHSNKSDYSQRSHIIHVLRT